MKYLYLSMLLVFTFGCSKNEFNEKHIFVPLLEEFIPDEYFNKSKAIFNNGGNESIVMNITGDKRSSQQELSNGELTTIDDYLITLYSEEETPVNIVILGTGIIHFDNSPVTPIVNVKLMPFQTPGGLWMDLKLDAEEATSIYNASFNKLVELNSCEFESVYSVKNNDSSAYSELYMANKFGVVGFSDIDGVLWSFSEYIE